MRELQARIFGQGVELIFRNVRSDRTIVVERAVKVGNMTFARNGAELFVFDLSRRIHRRIGDRGSLTYVEAAWRLGAFKKRDFDRLVAERAKREAISARVGSASDALENLRSVGLQVPVAFEKALKKIAGKDS